MMSEHYYFNWKDIKVAYWGLNEWKKIAKMLHLDVVNNEPLIQRKRAIRDFFKRESEKGVRRVINGNADDCWESVIWLLELPKEIKTRDQAEDWFQYNERLEYIPSAYDCTGQQFTSWYKLVKRRDRWWCYHCISIDV